jgi:hypothetical protein
MVSSSALRFASRVFVPTTGREKSCPPWAHDRDGNRLIVDVSLDAQLAVSVRVLDAVRNRFVCGKDDLVPVMVVHARSIKPGAERGAKPAELA